MKILRQRDSLDNYSALVNAYCCDNMRLARGSFGFHTDGKYRLRVVHIPVELEARFCPFCGEKFEIEKEIKRKTP